MRILATGLLKQSTSIPNTGHGDRTGEESWSRMAPFISLPLISLNAVSFKAETSNCLLLCTVLYLFYAVQTFVLRDTNSDELLIGINTYTRRREGRRWRD